MDSPALALEHLFNLSTILHKLSSISPPYSLSFLEEGVCNVSNLIAERVTLRDLRHCGSVDHQTLYSIGKTFGTTFRQLYKIKGYLLTHLRCAKRDPLFWRIFA